MRLDFGNLRLDPEDIAAIAASVAASINSTNGASSPWMNAQEAATYLRCPISRVRKLTSTGELPHERDGRRVLYHRHQLDDFIRRGGALSP